MMTPVKWQRKEHRKYGVNSMNGEEVKMEIVGLILISTFALAASFALVALGISVLKD